MRELKFRAFIDSKHKMKEVIYIDTTNKFIGVDLYDEDEMDWDTKMFVFNQVELMQYTGLKDKECAEVYEGDIVKIGGCIDVIIFENGKFTTKQSSDKYQSLYNYIDRCEVIGNIYENEDLL